MLTMTVSPAAAELPSGSLTVPVTANIGVLCEKAAKATSQKTKNREWIYVASRAFKGKFKIHKKF